MGVWEDEVGGDAGAEADGEPERKLVALCFGDGFEAGGKNREVLAPASLSRLIRCFGDN